ncbi:hypothetical protein A6A21_02460 [Phocoenobacter uteri]|nr:hypothetical protein [Phocoenobacter uteri]
MRTLLIKLLQYWGIQFFIGAFVSLYLVGVVMWNADLHSWFTVAIKGQSLCLMVGVYLCTFFSINRFSIHLHNLSYRYIIPIFSFWLMVALLCLLIFRLSYSVYYLGGSGIVMLSLFLFFEYINMVYDKKIVGYLPFGNIYTPEVSFITWVKIDDAQKVDKNIDIIMADLRAGLPNKWMFFLADCSLKGIPVYHSSRLLEMVLGRVKIDHMYENELGSLLPSKRYQVIKRIIDVFLVIVSLPITFPLLIITGLVVMIDTKAWCIFSQIRIGQGGKPFVMYKFRSMCKRLENTGAKFTKHNDFRITSIGRFIRKTRIDELPQLFNVLRGDMSLIGPRPEQVECVENFNKEIPFYNYRHIVKPGISGWAQVEYGYTENVAETKVKLEYDFYYIKNLSFSFDLLIFFKTIRTIITGFGAR